MGLLPPCGSVYNTSLPALQPLHRAVHSYAAIASLFCCGLLALQVLLSCSHVFHTQCLASFEAHVRVKACPLCRKQWYQKHTISDAAEAFRHVCAAR